MLLISLTLFFFLRLTYEIQKEKQQYTILISLGNLSYDQDFLKKASKINRLQGIWPVVEIGSSQIIYSSCMISRSA